MLAAKAIVNGLGLITNILNSETNRAEWIV
jgi:hypothetical protein